MAQPTPYDRQYNFNDFATTSPSDPLPGVQVDNELNSVKTNLDGVNANIGKIQRDDGKLANQSVHKNSFDTDALALIGLSGYTVSGDWAASSTYTAGTLVDFNAATYLATVAHTAGTVFVTDLNAGKWILLANAAINTSGHAVDKFEGNGSQTQFTLSYTYSSTTDFFVFVNGALRNPNDDYTLSGTTLTLATPPSTPSVSGNENVIVWGASVSFQFAKNAAATSASNASSFATASQNSATASASSASAASTSEGNASTSAGTASTQAGIATTKAAEASTSETNASGSASTATTQAGIATTKAGEASTSASTATTQAGISTTQATNSANSASTALSHKNDAETAKTASETAQTASETARTAAQNAQAAAEAALDTLDDKFLGAKSSNPTLDNDNNALQDGALYFDTTLDLMKVYDLTNTQWRVVSLSSSDQASVNTVAGIASDVTAVANNSSNINALNATGVISDIGTVATNASTITSVAGLVSGVQTFAVTVAGGLFVIDGVNNPALTLVRGFTYTFDVSNSSNAGHPLAFKNGSASYTTGVTSSGTPGQAGATVTFAVPNNAPSTGLLYYCTVHGNSMGNTITTSNNDMATVVANLSGINNFAERYRVQSGTPATDNDIGDLVFDTASSTLKVFGASGFQNAGSSVNGTSARFHYDITSTVQSVTGSDANGNTLAYDAGFIDVYVNGVRMSTADVTVTSGDTVTFASALASGDEVDIVAFGTFSIANMDANNLSAGTIPDARFPATLPAISGANLTNLDATDLTGTIASARISGAYTGITTAGQLTFGDDEKAIFGAGSDLQIYHDPNAPGGSTNFIKENSGIYTFIQADTLRLRNRDGSKNYINMVSNAGVDIYYNNSPRLSTTSTGVSVTGNIANASGNLTIDVVGGIILDADGGEVQLHDGGTEYVQFKKDSNNVQITSGIQDGDILFRGNDGGSMITALTLNMSDGGTAQFNDKIQCNSINTGSSVGTLTMFGGGTNKGGTIELSGGNNTGSTGSGIVFKTGASTSSPSERVRINSSGNTGFGITNPLSRIHVKQHSTAYGIVVEANGNDAWVRAHHNNSVGIIETTYDISAGYTPLVFKTGGSERMRIDSSGNVGIANQSPSSYGNATELVVGNHSINDAGITIATTTNSSARFQFADNTSSPFVGAIEYSHNNDAMTFYTAGSSRLRITSGGRVLINNTNDVAMLNVVSDNMASYTGIQVRNNTNNTGSIFAVFVRSSGAGVGSISQSGGGNNVTFNTSSDYRLKQNVSYTWDATTRLKQLKPARFSWIDDNTNTLEDGFLAHEVSSIVPEAIIGAKDGTQDIGTVKDADGNIIEINLSEIKFTERKKETLDLEGNTVDAVYPSNYTWTKTNTENVYQTIDHSKLVSLLVKTIQELEARITALESA